MQLFVLLDAVRDDWPLATVSFSLGVLLAYSMLWYCQSRLNRRLDVVRRVVALVGDNPVAGEQEAKDMEYACCLIGDLRRRMHPVVYVLIIVATLLFVNETRC